MQSRSWISSFSAIALLLFSTLFIVGGSLETRLLAQPPIISTSVIQRSPDFEKHFKTLGVNGSLIVYDSNQKQTYEYNPQRNGTELVPASTFKIFNAMVALETGVIPDDVAVLTWDGIRRKVANQDFPAWNHDTNLRQAFKDSTVWFYQVLARRAGHERMQQWIDKVGYGNRQIGGVDDIDRFWLQRMSEKYQALCICPLNPPKLGDFEFRTPQFWGAGGRVQRCSVVFRHPLKAL